MCLQPLHSRIFSLDYLPAFLHWQVFQSFLFWWQNPHLIAPNVQSAGVFWTWPGLGAGVLCSFVSVCSYGASPLLFVSTEDWTGDGANTSTFLSSFIVNLYAPPAFTEIVHMSCMYTSNKFEDICQCPFRRSNWCYIGVDLILCCIFISYYRTVTLEPLDQLSSKLNPLFNAICSCSLFLTLVLFSLTLFSTLSAANMKTPVFSSIKFLVLPYYEYLVYILSSTKPAWYVPMFSLQFTLSLLSNIFTNNL